MIESCTRKRMIIAIAFLIGLSIIVVLVENEWTPDDVHYHSQSITSDNLSLPQDCWKQEEFVALEECQPCTEFEIKSKVVPCDSAKYSQKVNCSKTGIVKIKCDRVVWLEEKQFILFEISMIALGSISGTLTFYRQKILDNRIYQRIQKQVASGV